MSLMSVQALGKAYKSYKSEWHRVGRWLGLPIKPKEEHWVLRHISFDIRKGEAIGIIGQNGAGKSTLLKLITGTAQPTEGRVIVNGRIAAILELGMGFDAELTGRQNVFHAAGLMGFSYDQIVDVIPQIEGFAEIAEYFDESVRTYSSGMQVRLAFSVATAWRPEILIIDEALSVGDAYFQHKSFSRIREFQEDGTTLLIVSHDRAAIQSLCDRAILLEKGVAIKDGNPEEIFDFYNALIAEKENKTVSLTPTDNGKMQTSSGTGEARVERIAIYNSQAEEVDFVNVGEQIELQVEVKIYKKLETLVFGYGIKDRLGQVMYGTNTWHTKQVIEGPHEGGKYLFRIAFPVNLGVGSYSIQTALTDRDTHLIANYEWRDLALVFNVINTDKTFFAGCLWNQPEITVEEA